MEDSFDYSGWLCIWNIHGIGKHAYVGPFVDIDAAYNAGDVLDLIDPKKTWSVCYGGEK